MKRRPGLHSVGLLLCIGYVSLLMHTAGAIGLSRDEGIYVDAAQRYAGWESESARKMLEGKISLAAIADAALAEKIAPKPHSGRQEYLENLVSRYTSLPSS